MPQSEARVALLYVLRNRVASMTRSVTRWQDFFQHLATYTDEKFAQKHKQFAKVGVIISQMQTEGFKNCPKTVKLGQSCEFSPNLVTLIIGAHALRMYNQIRHSLADGCFSNT